MTTGQSLLLAVGGIALTGAFLAATLPSGSTAAAPDALVPDAAPPPDTLAWPQTQFCLPWQTDSGTAPTGAIYWAATGQMINRQAGIVAPRRDDAGLGKGLGDYWTLEVGTRSGLTRSDVEAALAARGFAVAFVRRIATPQLPNCRVAGWRSRDVATDPSLCRCGTGCWWTQTTQAGTTHRTGIGGVAFAPGAWSMPDGGAAAGVCVPTPCALLAGSPGMNPRCWTPDGGSQ